MIWPQITMIALLAAGTGISLARHGKPKEGKESCIPTFISTIIIVYLLYAGGFWIR